MPVESSSEQFGSATRGTEAGSTSQVAGTGAGSGVAQGASGYVSSGSETTSDIGQAERALIEHAGQTLRSGSFDNFMNGHLARLALFAEAALARSNDLANRVAHFSSTHDNNMNSVNQSERERTVRTGDKTNTLDIATLAQAIVAGLDACGKINRS